MKFFSPTGILLAKARSTDGDSLLPIVSIAPIETKKNKKRDRYVNQPVWGEFSRRVATPGSLSKSGAHIPDSFNCHPLSLDSPRGTPTPPPRSFFLPFSRLIFKRMGARARISSACTSVGACDRYYIDYGPGTRSSHITFHFITHCCTKDIIYTAAVGDGL